MAEHQHELRGHQEYRHGEMDIEEHQKMFDKFVHFWFYLFLGTGAVLILLALTNA